MSLDAAERRSRVLVLSLAPVGREMTGPAIRAYELSRVLAREADVTLAATEVNGTLDIPCVSFDRHDGRSLKPHLQDVDFVLAQPQWPLVMRSLRRSGARLVFDLYDPEPLEALEYLEGARPLPRRLVSAMTVDRVVEAMRIGDFLICASQKQLDLWLGAMLAERMVSPGAYDRDPTFRSVIATVPFGVPDEPPQSQSGAAIRERFPAIGPESEIVIWNGGIWRWLDAATAIEAAGILAERRPSAKLVFMGTSDQPAGRRALDEARGLAERLGLLDSVVFFNDSWVPYVDRGAWLLDSQCALSCHRSHLESRFAFRTRLLDCLWAGLPVICTRGDALAEEIDAHDLGRVVAEGDPSATAAAVEGVLERGKSAYASALAQASERHRWERVAEPLLEYLRSDQDEMAREAPARRRPGHEVRDRTYRAVRSTLNRVGVRGWPRAPSSS